MKLFTNNTIYQICNVASFGIPSKIVNKKNTQSIPSMIPTVTINGDHKYNLLNLNTIMSNINVTMDDVVCAELTNKN